MDIYKDNFCGYGIYYKYYKSKWRNSGYFAKNSNGEIFNHNGKTIFDKKEELYAHIREKSGGLDIVYTDPYNIAVRWYKNENNKNNENYEEIGLLIDQYYYGLEAKKDLKRKLLSMKLIAQ